MPLEEENLTFDLSGRSLAVTISAVSGAPRATLILLHGGPGGQRHGPANLYADMAELLATYGFASIRFDFSGSGDSTGSYRQMTMARQVEEFHAVYQRFVEPREGPHVVVGESYGATIAVLGLPADTSSLVLLWPALWLLDKTFESYVEEEKLAQARERGFIVEEGEEIGEPFLDELIAKRDLENELRDIHVPTLLIHGNNDSEVPYSQSQRAAAIIPGRTHLRLVDGGDHCLELPSEREIVFDELGTWLEMNYPRS